MSNRIKQKAKSAVPMTETQKHIKELREIHSLKEEIAVLKAKIKAE